MRVTRLFSVMSLSAGLALIMSACDTNVAVNNANTRNANANSNTAGLVNATPASNTNRWSNVNANTTREEYDRNRADYERDKGSSTIGQGANDSWLWFKTRAALLTTSDLRDSTIDVDVVNDVVTLRGTVETAAQKARAETVAKGIEGQKGVRNQLTVRPADSVTNQIVNGNTNRR